MKNHNDLAAHIARSVLAPSFNNPLPELVAQSIPIEWLAQFAEQSPEIWTDPSSVRRILAQSFEVGMRHLAREY